MISRLSAKLIADAYDVRFPEELFLRRQIGDELYTFLYGYNFDPSLLNSIKKSYDQNKLKYFIMRLHTGESISVDTNEWTWQERQSHVQQILIKLANYILHDFYTCSDVTKYNDVYLKAIKLMQNSLELDGYIYSNGSLLVPEESVIDEAEETGILENLMISVGLKDITTLKHHLDLSVTDYQESKWDDSISNSRKVLEGILAQVANRFNEVVEGAPLQEKILSSSSLVRDYLEKQGLIGKSEKETISQVYRLLSETGGHPYMAQRDQARLLRHLALIFSQFILLRLESALQSYKEIN